MALIDDYTAMYSWDLASATLRGNIGSVQFTETADWSTRIMDSGDVNLAGASALSNLGDMEASLLHESAVVANRAFLDDYTNLFAAFVSWYCTGVDGLYASVNAALTARHYRLPYLVKNAFTAIQGGTINIANCCPYQDLVMARAIKGAATTVIAALPSDVSYAVLVAQANGAIGGTNHTLALTATYSDDTTGAESTTITNSSPNGTRFNIGSNAVTGDGALSGELIIPMTTTAGMVAGQKVLLIDGSWCTKLTSDCNAADVFYVENSRPFQPGDAIHLHDDNTADENVTILTVNHETHLVTLTANAVGTFTTGQSAHMRLATPENYGWTEVMEIDSVQTNVSITLTSAIVNSYSSDARAVRLIKSFTAATLTGTGVGGDCVDILAIPDRPYYESLNSSSSSSSSRSFSSSSSSSSSSSASA